jgi:hypothetical protein
METEEQQYKRQALERINRMQEVPCESYVFCCQNDLDASVLFSELIKLKYVKSLHFEGLTLKITFHAQFSIQK